MNNSNTASVIYNLRRGDVFIGRHGHTIGKVLRVEGANGPWFVVRHQSSNVRSDILPTTLFSSWEPVGEEAGAALYPWDGDRSVVSVSSADAPVATARPRKKREGDKPVIKRAKMEPSTGDVSVLPWPTVAHEPVSTSPPPAINDTTTAPLASTVPASQPSEDAPQAPSHISGLILLSETVNRMLTSQEERMSKMALDLEERMQRQSIQFAEIIKELKGTTPKSEPTKADEKEEASVKLVNSQKPWVKPLLDKFITDELERIDPNRPDQKGRALRPLDLFNEFNLWLVTTGRVAHESVYQRTVFTLLLDHPVASLRKKISSKDEIMHLALRDPRQSTLPFASVPDANRRAAEDVAQYGAKLLGWSGATVDAATRRATEMIGGGKFTAADLKTAIRGASLSPADRLHAYTPDVVFPDATVPALIKRAQKAGGIK